jgi:hypothetical protein
MRVPASVRDRLDSIATDATDALGCDVGRATVARAAFTMWLATVKEGDSTPFFDAIRVAIVKRGRKPRQPAPQVVAHGEEASA